VTAIASDPQRNLDFYVGTLGLRFVKRTVNFDDPTTYHFYFGDANGSPGTILTFFPWPGARRGSRGNGEVAATAFSIPQSLWVTGSSAWPRMASKLRRHPLALAKKSSASPIPMDDAGTHRIATHGGC
jgi:catechol 2,3-dioxygenase-like lactoylglutathione lyase family enzyme